MKIVRKYVELGRLGDALRVSGEEGLDDSNVKEMIMTRQEYAMSAFMHKHFDESAEHFISIIGASQISVFLSKFYRPELRPYVIKYLMEVHKRGYATSKVTQLMFTLFASGNAREQLDLFLRFVESVHKWKRGKEQVETRKGKQHVEYDIEEVDNERFLQNFNADAAIETLQKNNMSDESKHLSQIIGISTTSVYSLLERQKFTEAAELIFDHLDEPIGQQALLKFGATLLGSPAARTVEDGAAQIWRTTRETRDLDFLKLFWGRPQNCYRFLKSIVGDRPTTIMANVFISLLIPVSGGGNFYGHSSIADSGEAIRAMGDSRWRYDLSHIASVCVNARFWRGFAFLMQKVGRVGDALHVLLLQRSTDELVDFVSSDPVLTVDDWYALLEHIAAPETWRAFADRRDRVAFLRRIAGHLSGRIPWSLVQRKVSWNRELLTELEPQLRCGASDPMALLRKITEEVRQVNAAGAKLSAQSLASDETTCAGCHASLVPPYVVFFCGHCYHRECLPRDETGGYCMACGPRISRIDQYGRNDVAMSLPLPMQPFNM